MRPLDWIVLAGALAAMIAYGLYKGRGSNTVDKYLLAGKTMPWYAMALSIMATQASAITFLTTTGQGYADGMRFVQMYFGCHRDGDCGRHGRAHLPPRQRLHGLRIPGAAVRLEDARPRERHFHDPSAAWRWASRWPPPPSC